MGLRAMWQGKGTHSKSHREAAPSDSLQVDKYKRIKKQKLVFCIDLRGRRRVSNTFTGCAFFLVVWGIEAFQNERQLKRKKIEPNITNTELDIDIKKRKEKGIYISLAVETALWLCLWDMLSISDYPASSFWLVPLRMSTRTPKCWYEAPKMTAVLQSLLWITLLVRRTLSD